MIIVLEDAARISNTTLLLHTNSAIASLLEEKFCSRKMPQLKAIAHKTIVSINGDVLRSGLSEQDPLPGCL